MTLAGQHPGGRDASSWLLRPAPNPAARARLFCVPYAGGSAYMFRSWPGLLPASVEVIAVQLPGRGAHLQAPPFTAMPALVDALVEQLTPWLDRPYALFGHSMGAMIGFEVARRLRELGRRAPAQLFVSGRRAPQLADDTAPTYNLPEIAFVEELRRLRGTPPEVLAHDELMQLLVPVLRADFSLCQTYAYRPAPPLACPITAFCGEGDDEETAERMAAWREQTSAAFELHTFAGDHFFLTAAAPRMLRVIGHGLEHESR